VVDLNAAVEPARLPLARSMLGPEFTLRENPRQRTVEMQLNLQNDASIELHVYDTRGIHIATLDQGRRSAGSYRYTWDASGFGAGMYYAQLSSPRGRTTTAIALP
jgi:hypothetical protein